MVVQHNLRAMNSNRMLGLTTNVQAKSTEKLSSGYKINRAADDAAGLSISEKMRKQIRGLSQASLNAADGISAVQTAEGALNEVQDMLQRMNELAVKAANGTMSDDDRNYIQDEISQLETEINRVATTTKFNETYLLKGDENAAKTTAYSYKMIDVAASFERTTATDSFYRAGGTTALADSEIIAILESGGKIYADTANIQNESDSITLTWKDSKAAKLTIDLTAWTTADSLTIGNVAFEETAGGNVDTMAAALNADATFSTTFFAEKDTEGNLVITALNAATKDTALADLIALAEIGGADSAAALKAAVESNRVAGLYDGNDSYITAYDSVYYAEDGASLLDSAAVESIIKAGGKVYSVDGGAQTEAADTAYEFTDSSREMATLYDANGKKVKASELADMADSVVLYTDSGANAEDSVAMADISAYTESAEVNSALALNLHVGADATDDNKIGLEIKSMSAAAIGIMNLDVTTEENATAAIDVIADALQQVSTQRSALGAIQNRLEHTIANLDNVVENTTAAESQIRDTDMATEMVKFSNNNILAQAGQAMLAQANQANQGVLSLLG